MTTDQDTAALVDRVRDYIVYGLHGSNLELQNLLDQAAAALERPAPPELAGWRWVPEEPTDAMWGGLARDIVFWDRYGKHNGSELHAHLKSLGREMPDWLAKEIPDTDQVPPKGTVAACIYKAMLQAAPTPAPKGEI